jgi:hypothetical protein
MAVRRSCFERLDGSVAWSRALVLVLMSYRARRAISELAYTLSCEHRETKCCCT